MRASASSSPATENRGLTSHEHSETILQFAASRDTIIPMNATWQYYFAYFFNPLGRGAGDER